MEFIYEKQYLRLSRNGFLVIYVIAASFVWIGVAEIPNDLTPVSKYDVKDTLNYPVFLGTYLKTANATLLQDLQGMKKIKRNYYIYGREAVFVISANLMYPLSNSSTEIPCQQDIKWKANESYVEVCLRKGQDEENCRSYIKLLQEDVSTARGASSSKRLIVCSSNAFNPKCKIFLILESGKLEATKELFDGKLMCPQNSNEKAISLLADNNLYTASVDSFTQYDPLMMRSRGSLVTLGTPRSESTVFNQPEFIRFVDTGNSLNKVLVFFNERAVEVNSNRVYSRVGQACKNDEGGKNLFRNQFSSFFKARLNCSIPGRPTFYFDELNDVSDLVIFSSWYGKNRKKMVIAIMNTPRNSVPASAICAYTLDDIEATLTGSFYEKHTFEPNDQVVWVKQDKYPRPHLANCDRLPTQETLQNLNFVMKHPLMYQSVPAWSFLQGNSLTSSPLYTRTRYGSFFTTLALDTSAGTDGKYAVFFAGSEDGNLSKILLLQNGSSLLVEERSVYNPEKCKGSKSVRKIILDKITGTMMIAFQNCVILAPLCPLTENKCERDCIKARDPYCGWESGKCSTVNKISAKVRQDILQGNVDSIPPCEVLTATGDKDMSPTPNSSNCDLPPCNNSTLLYVLDNGRDSNPSKPTLTQDLDPNVAGAEFIAVIGIVCLIAGICIGIGIFLLKRRLCNVKMKLNDEKESSKDKEETDKGTVRYITQRHGSTGSRGRRHSGDPRTSLLIDSNKRNRTLTETSGRCEDGNVYFSIEKNQSSQGATTEANHPPKRQQHLSTDSSIGGRRRHRSSKPSVTSEADHESPEGSEKRHSPRSLDQGYEDPFLEEVADSGNRKLVENQPSLEPVISLRDSTPYVTLASSNPEKQTRIPPARATSYQGPRHHSIQRAYSIAANGASTMDHNRSNFKGVSRQLSMQLPNGVYTAMYSPRPLQTPPVSSPGKRYALVQHMQPDSGVVSGKNSDIRYSDFTHSLDRRRKPNGLNYPISLAETYDENIHPLAYSGRKRVVSESEKVIRTPMSRPPLHHVINEEEEPFLTHQRGNNHERTMNPPLRLEIPRHIQSFGSPLSAKNQSSHANPYNGSHHLENGQILIGMPNHSGTFPPVRDEAKIQEQNPRFLPQHEVLPEAVSMVRQHLHLSNDGRPNISNPSSPVDDPPASYPINDKIRHPSGNIINIQQLPPQSPSATSAPFSIFANSGNFQPPSGPRTRHLSGSSRIPHSPSDERDVINNFSRSHPNQSSQMVANVGYG